MLCNVSPLPFVLLTVCPLVESLQLTVISQKRKRLFDFGENETEDLTMNSDSAQTELGKYLVNADSVNDPTVFWKTHKEEFPRLLVIAQQICNYGGC